MILRMLLGQDAVMPTHYSPDVEDTMRRFFDSLPERERRHYAAVEAAKLGRGGTSYLAQILGCDEKTIRRGKRERIAASDLPSGRSRKKGVDGDG